jgi:tape measure domain-containing protein
MSNGFTYLINLNVGGMGAIGKLLSMLDSLDSRIGQVEHGMDKFNRELDQAGAKGRAAFGGIGAGLGSLAAQIGVAATAMTSLNTAVDVDSMERSIRFAGGADGPANLEFVKKAADDLRLPLSAATEGFKALSGGMMGTQITMEQQRDIFTAVGKASTVMGLSADQSQGAFIALSQMASKGTVSAEELRGQLGERLPGAFNIAARAMGVSTMELGKMMEQGKVVSEDFLPKFATELHKAFGPGMAEAINSPRAMMNQMGNEVMRVKNEIGMALLPVASKLIHEVLIPGAKWFRENSDAIFTVAGAFGTMYLAAKTYTTMTAIQSLVTKGFTGTVWGLNKALLMNPITWVVGGVIALGAAVYYAWNHFEGFRGVVTGIGTVLYDFWQQVLKPVADFIGKHFVYNLQIMSRTLDAVGHALGWVWQQTETVRKFFWGLWDSIKDGAVWIWNNIIKPFTMVGKLFSGIAQMFESTGFSVGQSFTSGWNSGVEGFGQVPGASGVMESAAQGGVPGVPGGVPPPTNPPGADKGTKMANSITGGGQRNVTINLGSLNQGGITINAKSMGEGTDQMVEMLTRKLLQVLNSANQVQTN